MPYVFDHLDLIEKLLKRSPFGLVTDVDGTISETAPTPQQAEVSPLCRHYLSLLSQHLALVAAISGRPADEVKNMLKIDGVVYIGNHGLERWVEGHSEFTRDAQDYPEVIKTVIRELAPSLSIEGVRIEDKGITATIHYRLCREPRSVEKIILARLQDSSLARRLRVMQGRMSINLLPPVEGNKGTAVLDLIREYNLQSGIYLGDDITDIDAFRAIHSASHSSDFQGLAIGIISQEISAKLVAEADFTLNGVNDVERFLKWMSQTALEPS
ncbi:MAG: trehalose-phosphatase [Dehalococcoidia bacterium]|nr:MAG: trehalose-phosphatase [Dehalococcoidia bacterium]